MSEPAERVFVTDHTKALPLDPESEARLRWFIDKIRDLVLSTRGGGRRELDIKIVGFRGGLSKDSSVGRLEIEHPP